MALQNSSRLKEHLAVVVIHLNYFSLKISHRDIAAINFEYEALVSTNCETSTPNAGCILRRGIKDLPEKAQESYLKLKLSAPRTTTSSRVQSSTQEERATTPPQRPSIASWGTSSSRH